LTCLLGCSLVRNRADFRQNIALTGTLRLALPFQDNGPVFIAANLHLRGGDALAALPLYWLIIAVATFRYFQPLLILLYACTAQQDKGRIAQLEKQTKELQEQVRLFLTEPIICLHRDVTMTLFFCWESLRDYIGGSCWESASFLR
jgi:hypothetical protein